MAVFRTFLSAAALAAVLIPGVARAAAPTAEQCDATYKACDAACQAADPKHGFSYAGCSAKCVAAKAACEGEIVYDATADWSKRQYNTAKPWVQEKTRQTKELIQDAPNNTEYKYPPNDTK